MHLWLNHKVLCTRSEYYLTVYVIISVLSYCWEVSLENVTLMEILAICVLFYWRVSPKSYHFTLNSLLHLTDYFFVTQKQLKVWFMFYWNKQHTNFYHILWNSRIDVFRPVAFLSHPLMFPSTSSLDFPNYRWQQINENRTVYIATLLQA